LEKRAEKVMPVSEEGGREAEDGGGTGGRDRYPNTVYTYE
jgi:hypothetical protein